MNNVTPTRKREIDKDGNITVLEEYDCDAFDPYLCVRGVMPMQYLKDRSDYRVRFKGCETPGDVGRVLALESS